MLETSLGYKLSLVFSLLSQIYCLPNYHFCQILIHLSTTFLKDVLSILYYIHFPPNYLHLIIIKHQTIPLKTDFVRSFFFFQYNLLNEVMLYVYTFSFFLKRNQSL